MTDAATNATALKLLCELLPGEDLRVSSGVNLGGTLGTGEEPVPGDIYTLSRDARTRRLAIENQLDAAMDCPQPRQVIAEGSDIGPQGAPARPTRSLTFMCADGDTVEALLLDDLATAGPQGQRGWVLPLSPMTPGQDYALIAMGEARPPIPQPDLGCVCFTRSTLIDLAGGVRKPIEQLRPGDMVLTRDRGPMPVRWVGQSTRRAAGPLAPVVIAPGAIGNREELIVSPRHRLLIEGAVGPRMVEAGDLVDDDRIRFRAGGFVAYYHVLLDTQEIIFAAGLPAESLHINPQTMASFDVDARRTIQSSLSWAAPRPHRALSLPDDAPARPVNARADRALREAIAAL